MFQVKKLIGAGITLSAGLVAVVCSDVANAAQLFTNRQEWEAAIPGEPFTFEFDDLAGAPVPPGSVLPNGLSVNYNETTTEDPFGFTGSVTTTGTGLQFLRNASNLDLTLGFESPVEAFGFDVSPSNAFFLISVPDVLQSTSVRTPSFIGYLADPGTSVNSVRLDCASGSCVGIGQVRIENITAVPEPSNVLGTLAVGMGGAGLLLKRKMNRKIAATKL